VTINFRDIHFFILDTFRPDALYNGSQEEEEEEEEEETMHLLLYRSFYRKPLELLE
jgi:hypothetical protein